MTNFSAHILPLRTCIDSR